MNSKCGPMPNAMATLPYRWRPLFNAAEFGWRPLVECRAVTLPRRETHWNLQGCLKLANRSQPVVGRSSPYYEDMWRRYCYLTSFFPIVSMCLMLRSFQVVNSCSRVQDRWKRVPFMSWARELVITTGELELGSCTSSSRWAWLRGMTSYNSR